MAKVCVEPQGELLRNITVMLEDGSMLDIGAEYPWKSAPKPTTKRWIPKAPATMPANTTKEQASASSPTRSVAADPVLSTPKDSNFKEVQNLLSAQHAPKMHSDQPEVNPSTNQLPLELDHAVTTNNIFSPLGESNEEPSTEHALTKRTREASKGVSQILQKIKSQRGKKEAQVKSNGSKVNKNLSKTLS